MVGKHRKQISLGRYPTDSLKDERNKAKHILLQHAARTSLTVDDAKAEFLDSCKKRLKIGTVQQYKSYPQLWHLWEIAGFPKLMSPQPITEIAHKTFRINSDIQRHRFENVR